MRAYFSKFVTWTEFLIHFSTLLEFTTEFIFYLIAIAALLYLNFKYFVVFFGFAFCHCLIIGLLLF